MVEPSCQLELYLSEENCDLEVELAVGAHVVGVGDFVEEEGEGRL